MRKLLITAIAVLMVIPSLVSAHGPSRQKVTEEITINAPPEEVWGMIMEFCAIETWHPAVAKCEGTGGNDVGATRLLTLGGGPQIEEELLKYDPEKMTYKYKITKTDVSALPVSTYSSTITVKPDDSGGSVVIWKGGFYRSYTLNEPPPEQSDEAAVTAVTGVYKSGLENIKKLAEQ